VRAGEDQASVTATFEFDRLPDPIRHALAEADVEIEPGEPLIVRRRLRAASGDAGTGTGGGSKAFINDQPVGVALLREIAPALVELHGQHDDRGLVNARGHRMLLDRYARADTGAVAAAWDKWRGAETALATARARVEAAMAEQDLLLAHLAELTTLAPVIGEEEDLALQRAAMQKGERLSGDLAELQHLWAGSDSRWLRCARRRGGSIASRRSIRCWPKRSRRWTAR
jgi:DNA repair protein RecN (Recombination protein N)